MTSLIIGVFYCERCPNVVLLSRYEGINSQYYIIHKHIYVILLVQNRSHDMNYSVYVHVLYFLAIQIDYSIFIASDVAITPLK